jgi:hypothetical protein
LPLGIGTILVLCVPRGSRAAWRIVFASFVLSIPLTLLVACGGGSTSVTPTGTYTIAIAAASGNDSHEAPVSVMVQVP